jgi:ribonuclease T2
MFLKVLISLVVYASVASAASDFDFFLLVRQYSPTLCSSTSCSKDTVSEFTIHGLWPEYYNGYPSYCTDASFSEKSLDGSTVDQMNCEWPSFNGGNSGFWSHEWEKHGTCSLDVLPTEEDYFSKGLEVNDMYDVNVALTKAGISIVDGNEVEASAIQAALNDAYGVNGVLKCQNGALSEVWMCLDKETYEPFQCPSSLSSTCSSYIEFPTADATVSSTCSKYFPSTTTSSSSSMGSSSASTSSAASWYRGMYVIYPTIMMSLLFLSIV